MRDQKTAQIAAELVARIAALMDAGNWQEAERLIEAGCSSPNRPFLAEFEAQACAC